MEEKRLIIKFTKGVTYVVPARMIAEDRARYYASVDGYEEDSQEFLDEVNATLDDEFMILDWVENNMNWCDLEPYAVKLGEDILDLEEEWLTEDRTLSINW